MPQIQVNKGNFIAVLSDFYQGFSPIAHIDSLTEKGNQGHASVMSNADILDGLLTQGPGLANLTNGTQAGAVTELINYILDIPVADSVTYGVGNTKLFKITPTTVTSDATWPQTITSSTEGSSVANLDGNVYTFFNKATGGDISKLTPPSTFDHDWGSTVPTGKGALQKAPHPVAVKEDLMVFGNGQYLGVYTGDSNTIELTKLNFGAGYEVADVLFNSNYWYIAVNSGIAGTNRSMGQVYLYDGGATKSILTDELGVGFQKIGFLYLINGVVFVAYQDLTSSTSYNIGYIAGRQIKKLASFTGSLPNFQKKTLYKDTILFASGAGLWSFGAISPDLPPQISQIADGGYTTLGALAAPFGTPMIASTETTNYKLAKFSGYDTASSWKSVVINTSLSRAKGYIDDIIVLTSALGADAKASLTVEANQGVTVSNAKSIETTGKTRHLLGTFGLGQIEDFRIAVSFSTGNTTNPCKIRQITIRGHLTEA